MPVSRTGLAALVAATLAGVAGSAAAAPPPPELQAKQARARTVLAQVQVLDRRFGRVVDAWDGARIALAQSRRRLAANARALRQARRESRAADRRLGERLVAIYEGGEPTVVDVVSGAHTLGELLDRFEAANAVAGNDRRLADAARRSRRRLEAVRRRLRADERVRQQAVAELAANRTQIGAMLGRRRRLLASVREQVAELQRREAARQKRLAAGAKARLAREQAQREAEAKAAAAKAAAARKAKAPAPAPAVTAPATTTVSAAPPPPPTTAPSPAAPPPAASTPATTAAPSATLPAGHPEAATVALRYLGIPYKWGGASPATGFDCSGLVMYVYAQLGIRLPHQSAAQYGLGVPVARSALRPGDLVFYDGLSHVAISIGNGQVVHAPQTGDVVKIVALDAAGGSYAGARRLP